jgi:hypothetical protein
LITEERNDGKGATVFPLATTARLWLSDDDLFASLETNSAFPKKEKAGCGGEWVPSFASERYFSDFGD